MMASPTTRASNTWPINGGDDLLQIQGQGGEVVAGIDSSGAGFGALAGGNSSQISTADNVVNTSNPDNAGAITAVAGTSHTIVLSTDADFTNTFSLSAIQSTWTVGPGCPINITATDGDITFTTNGNVVFDCNVTFSNAITIPQSSTIQLLNFANNADAKTGGLTDGMMYQTGSDGTTPSNVCVVFTPL